MVRKEIVFKEKKYKVESETEYDSDIQLMIVLILPPLAGYLFTFLTLLSGKVENAIVIVTIFGVLGVLALSFLLNELYKERKETYEVIEEKKKVKK